MHHRTITLALLVMLCTAIAPRPSHAAGPVTMQGQLSAGGASRDSRSDAFTESLDKSVFDMQRPAARLAIRLDAALPAALGAVLIADADSQRSSVIDLQEAFLAWNPVPQSPWRYRARLGAFFPVTSLETGYPQVGWNAQRTISGSAINSWISEEIRILGAEFTLQWRGVMAGSPHTGTLRGGAFGGNDPAGTLIAWRGWNMGGRITGLFQDLRLPDLPVYRPDGPIAVQTRDVDVFREIDDRPGYYLAAGYAYEGVVDAELMHYDNRGDPLRIEAGQYSWRTKFDHLALRFDLPREWVVLAQAMRGSTLMGPNAVNTRFSSWYLLAAHPLGPGTATLRHDRFRTRDRDIIPEDANGERGHAWALAWSVPLPHEFTLVAEALRVKSNRPARALISEISQKTEDSLALELRWAF